MASSTEPKTESIADLDDLLQCPVCYEIPAGQIYQCNEGHHVCGRCKSRLELCPVCRSMYFGTRNYAMEELIANVRKLKAFKLGGKITVATSEAIISVSGATNSDVKNNNGISLPVAQAVEVPNNTSGNVPPRNALIRAQPQGLRPPLPCKGLFRCLCCKEGLAARLPLGRLLNHLRYYHPQQLVEGKAENGQYTQSWQLQRDIKRSVTAIRVPEMGVFYLIVEIGQTAIYAWAVMAASAAVAHDYRYVITLSARDREAFFTDCVWSVRACEGSLKKRNRCLTVVGADAVMMRSQSGMSVRLVLRHAPSAHGPPHPPRGMLRLANRPHAHHPPRMEQAAANGFTLEPLIQGLHDDVERLTRAFHTLGRTVQQNEGAGDQNGEDGPEQADGPAGSVFSRNARRRLQARLRHVLDAADVARPVPPPAPPAPRAGRNQGPAGRAQESRAPAPGPRGQAQETRAPAPMPRGQAPGSRGQAPGPRGQAQAPGRRGRHRR